MRDEVSWDVIRHGHRVGVRVESWLGDELLDDDLRVDDGSLDFTYGANVPGRLEISFPYDYLPSDYKSPLAAYGQRLNVTRLMANESGEYAINLGWYLIQGWDAEWPVVSVEAVSLEQLIADYRFEQAFQIAKNGSLIAGLGSICAGTIPVQFDSYISDANASTEMTWEESRMDAIRDIARALGADVRVDDDGILTVTPERKVESIAHRSFVHGEESAYVSIGTEAMRDEAYNAVIARGTKDDGTPVQGIAVDDDPTSPTYYYGPYGRRNRFYESQLIKTVAQAKSSAASILKQELYRSGTVKVKAPPDPRLEVGDTIEVTDESGFTVKGILLQMSLPLLAQGGESEYIVGIAPAIGGKRRW